MPEKEVLIKTANEINTELGLIPPINIGGAVDYLEQVIVKASKLVDCSDDFSDDVTKCLLDLNGLSEEVATLFEMKLNFVDTTEVSVKETVANTNEKKKSRKPHIVRLEQLIAEGKYSANQIISIILSEFNDLKKDTIANYIRSAKSEKYTQFQYVAIEDLQGVLRFDESLKV